LSGWQDLHLVLLAVVIFHHTTTTRQHVKAAGPWNQYASGHEP